MDRRGGSFILVLLLGFFSQTLFVSTVALAADTDSEPAIEVGEKCAEFESEEERVACAEEEAERARVEEIAKSSALLRALSEPDLMGEGASLTDTIFGSVSPDGRFSAPRESEEATGTPAEEENQVREEVRQRLQFGTVTVQGGLSSEQILEVAEASRESIENCFVQQLQRTPGTSGVISLSWVLMEERSVIEVNVHESTLRAPEIEPCLRRAVSSWSFPTVGEKITRVIFPIEFSGQETPNQQPQRQLQPRLTIGELRVDGDLAVTSVQRVARQRLRQLQYCYEVQLQNDHELAGSVVVAWSISGQGVVTEAQIIESALENDAAEQCLMRRINS